MKRLLVLGAGRVSAPLIRYFLCRRDTRVLIASVEVSSAQKLVEEYRNGRTLQTDVSDPEKLAPLIAEADAVVSLLPPALHPIAARLAVQAGVPFITTSYQAPAMLELNDEATAAGVVVLSECGLDPGLDHMSAARVIGRLHSKGARVSSFTSCCGGFPAPDSNDNPWGYKFSWNPRGVVLAGRMPAKYVSEGNIVEIPGEKLFQSSWRYEVEGQGVFEIYPNRDSTHYIELYGLTGIRNMFRGTIRYPGWCATMSAAARLGLFDVEVASWAEGTTYEKFLGSLVPGSGSLIARVADFLGTDSDSEIITRLEWAGFFSDRPIRQTSAAPIDLFLQRLEALMSYRPGERDMIALQHHFTASFPDGRIEHHQSATIMTGDAWGDSAMARSVALPAAIATRLILEGEINVIGCHIPTTPEFYDRILDELEDEGINVADTHSVQYPGPFQG